MGPQDQYVDTVLTCQGDFFDPEFHHHLREFRSKLQELIVQEPEKPQQLILKKVEPWNSVRVTFSIPREAALRLRQLAQAGHHTLRDMGILAVQIEGDRTISLTIAGKNNEKHQLVFDSPAVSQSSATAAAVGPSTSSGSSVFDLSGTEEMFHPGAHSVEATRKNIAQYLRQGLSAAQTVLEEAKMANDIKLTAGGRKDVFPAAAAGSSGFGSSGMQLGTVSNTPPTPAAPVNTNVMPYAQPHSVPEPLQQELLHSVPNPNAGLPVSDNAALASLMSEFNTNQGMSFPTNSPSGKQNLADKAMPVFSNADVTYSSPLLVNLLRNDALGGHLPNAFLKSDGEPPRKRRCRTKKSKKAQQQDCVKEMGQQSISSQIDGVNVVSTTTIVSSICTSMQSASVATVSSPGRKSPAASRVAQTLINPATGQLEVVGSPRQPNTSIEGKVKADSPTTQNMEQAPVLGNLHPPANPLVALQKRLEGASEAEAMQLLAMSRSGIPLGGPGDIANRTSTSLPLPQLPQATTSDRVASMDGAASLGTRDSPHRMTSTVNSSTAVGGPAQVAMASLAHHQTSIATTINPRPSLFTPGTQTTPAMHHLHNNIQLQRPPSELMNLEQMAAMAHAGNMRLPGPSQAQAEIGPNTPTTLAPPSRQQMMAETVNSMLSASAPFALTHNPPSRGSPNVSAAGGHAAPVGSHIPGLLPNQPATFSGSIASSLSSGKDAPVSSLGTVANPLASGTTPLRGQVPGPRTVTPVTGHPDHSTPAPGSLSSGGFPGHVPTGGLLPVSHQSNITSMAQMNPPNNRVNQQAGLPPRLQNMLPGQSVPGMMPNQQAHTLPGPGMMSNQQPRSVLGLGMMPGQGGQPGLSMPGNRVMHPMLSQPPRSVPPPGMLPGHPGQSVPGGGLMASHSVPGAGPGHHRPTAAMMARLQGAQSLTRPGPGLPHQGIPRPPQGLLPRQSHPDMSQRPPISMPPGGHPVLSAPSLPPQQPVVMLQPQSAGGHAMSNNSFRPHVPSPHVTGPMPQTSVGLEISQLSTTTSAIATSSTATWHGQQSLPEITTAAATLCKTQAMLPHPQVNNIHRHYQQVRDKKGIPFQEELMSMAGTGKSVISSLSENSSSKNGPTMSPASLIDSVTHHGSSPSSVTQTCISSMGRSSSASTSVGQSLAHPDTNVAHTHPSLCHPSNSALPQTLQKDNNIQRVMAVSTGKAGSANTQSSEKAGGQSSAMKQSSRTDISTDARDVMTVDTKTEGSDKHIVSGPAVPQASLTCDEESAHTLATHSYKSTHRTNAKQSDAQSVQSDAKCITGSSQCREATPTPSQSTPCDTSIDAPANSEQMQTDPSPQQPSPKHKQEVNGLADSSAESSQGEGHDGNSPEGQMASNDRTEALKSKQGGLGEAQSNDVSESLDTCIK